MKLKYCGILVAAIFVAFVEAAKNPECEQKVQDCVNAFIATEDDDKTEAESCRETRKMARCLTDVVHECQGEQRDEEMEKALEQMNKAVAEECADDVESCVEINGPPVVGICILTSFLGADTNPESTEGIDMDEMMCTINGLLMQCVKEAMTAECGEAGGELAVKMAVEMFPEDVRAQLRDSCNSVQGEQEENSVQALFSGQRKRAAPSQFEYRKKRAAAIDWAYKKKRAAPAQFEYRKKRAAPFQFEYRKKRAAPFRFEYRKKRAASPQFEYRKKRGTRSWYYKNN